MQRIKKKLSSKKGETILETLVALLIIVLSISFLSASIAKSASISNEIRKTTEEGFTYNGSASGAVTFPAISGVMSARSVPVYKVESEAGEYYYYEPSQVSKG